MSHSYFIYWSIDGHLGCFHILVIVNNSSMNIGVLMFFQISVSSFFRYIPRNGLLGKSRPLLCNFLSYIHIAFHSVCIPTNSRKGFTFLHILTSICCLLIYWWWPFWQVWDGVSLWFYFAFLWLVMLNIFSYAYWPCVCPLWISIYSDPLYISLSGSFAFWCWIL